jgi:hypothetical protein
MGMVIALLGIVLLASLICQLVFLPLPDFLLSVLHLPRWMSLGGFLLMFSWLIGE